MCMQANRMTLWSPSRLVEWPGGMKWRIRGKANLHHASEVNARKSEFVETLEVWESELPMRCLRPQDEMRPDYRKISLRILQHTDLLRYAN